MAVYVYLLSLADLNNPELVENFLEGASLLVDGERLRKAQKIRDPRGKAASLGAGLLLQKMVTDYRSGVEISAEQHYTAAELLSSLQSRSTQDSRQIPLPLQYRFGIQGKPEIVGFPLHFSLSHSGDYVLCVFSEREVGADIQIMKSDNVQGIAERFFSREECMSLENCNSDSEKQILFFGLWSKKEAYGKLTGRGVASVMDRDVRAMSGGLDYGNGEWYPCWLEISVPAGYAAAICIAKSLLQE